MCLTAVRDRDEAVQKHINDSLALLPAIDAQAAELSIEHLRIIDVGSGAGFPGVIIAIARPLWQVDSSLTIFRIVLDPSCYYFLLRL